MMLFTFDQLFSAITYRKAVLAFKYLVPHGLRVYTVSCRNYKHNLIQTNLNKFELSKSFLEIIYLEIFFCQLFGSEAIFSPIKVMVSNFDC